MHNHKIISLEMFRNSHTHPKSARIVSGLGSRCLSLSLQPILPSDVVQPGAAVESQAFFCNSFCKNSKQCFGATNFGLYSKDGAANSGGSSRQAEGEVVAGTSPRSARLCAAALALSEDDADNDTAAAPPLEAFFLGGGAEHGASSNAGLGSGGGSTSGAGVAGGGALHWEQACNGRRWWRCIGALHWEQAICQCLCVWFALLLIVCKGCCWEISPAHNPFLFQPVGGV